MEIWKKLPGWEYYEVSDLGQVKSTDRINLLIDGRKRKEKGKLMTQHPDKDGYLKVHLSGSKRCSIGVHILVALTFHDNPENKPQVNHKNTIKSDNRADNLEWNTNKENINHALSMGIKLGPKPENAAGVILTKEKVLEIRELRKTKMLKDIAKMYGITAQTVCDIIKRRSWKHVLCPILVILKQI